MSPPFSQVFRDFPSYEDVAAEHVLPIWPRNHERVWESGSLAQRGSLTAVDSVGRFGRAMLFVAVDLACFKSREDYQDCCRLGESPESCLFNELGTKGLCCAKVRHVSHLFEYQYNRGFSVSNLSAAPGSWWSTAHKALHPFRHRASTTSPWRQHDCQPLRGIQFTSGAGSLLPWLSALLNVSDARLASCVSGVLSARLQAAPAAEASEAMVVLSDFLEKRCCNRRAQLALRRNVMLWHQRLQAPGDGFGRIAELSYRRTMFALEACRKNLGPARVLQLHIPKTAGSSIGSWARDMGFQFPNETAEPFLERGDGPFWLGGFAMPASCAQRRQESLRENATWTTVERWLDLPLCEDLSYVVALREPVMRTIHQFQHLFRLYPFKMNERNGLEKVEEKGLSHLMNTLWRFGEVRSSIDGRHGQGLLRMALAMKKAGTSPTAAQTGWTFG
ncbi:unnamed protein product [Polarella glacialis]|uniref:Sulfotransferase n=1 Tax=Polarella glacialis TaxID=89957 RepID=A0A813GV73_POLGL|nr:unnamed protein product [Polarella glacialis]